MRARTIPLALGGAMGAMLLAGAAGFRFNATNSMPVGVWHVREGNAIKRGEIVTVCLPDAPSQLARQRGYVARGSCPDGAEPLVKPVAAVAGDVVTVQPGGIAVNGRAIPNTAALSRDEAGRPLHGARAGSHVVASGEAWLLSGRDGRSFDSRYFGPVPLSSITAAARPIWVRR